MANSKGDLLMAVGDMDINRMVSPELVSLEEKLRFLRNIDELHIDELTDEISKCS